MGGGFLAREKHKELVTFDLRLVTGQSLRAGEGGGRGMDERGVSGPGTLSGEAQSCHAWPRPFVKGLSAQDA